MELALAAAACSEPVSDAGDPDGWSLAVFPSDRRLALTSAGEPGSKSIAHIAP